MARRGAVDGGEERLRGPMGFETHYGAIFGERWPRLRAALLGTERTLTSRYVRENGFADLGHFRELADEGMVQGSELRHACHRVQSGAKWFERDDSGLVRGYAMDPASVLAAHALPLAGARVVLDLCAAPGGKALVLAERAAAETRLVLNERSPARRVRLEQVLVDYLPPSVRARITVASHDGRSFGVRRPSAFDAVLLDAPCSSEEQLLCDQAALARWSISQSERVSREQDALLAAALLAVKPGGPVLYVTSALSPLENDGVVRRILEKGRPAAEVEPLRLAVGEATELGWQVLPDESGWGPLYCSLLRKLEA